MTQRMQAWQVTGPGEPADVLHRVEVDLPEAGARAGADPGDRGRASGFRTSSCAAAPTR